MRSLRGSMGEAFAPNARAVRSNPDQDNIILRLLFFDIIIFVKEKEIHLIYSKIVRY